ncbi:MAG: recombinase family protein [Synergistaceae bacterium]|nr:recombinase family protein [Synergistaceae bacterium]
MIYGYARVSTTGQARDGNSIEAQTSALQQAGAEKIFHDVFSGKAEHRPQLDKLLKVIQSGDRLIITKLDRIARSLIQGIQLLESLSDKGVVIEVLNMGVIDSSPTGKLIRNIMLSFAEFERDMIIQRTQEGKAIARQKADYKDGRPKKFTPTQLNHALELLETHSYKQVERLTGISMMTIYRAKIEREKNKE